MTTDMSTETWFLDSDVLPGGLVYEDEPCPDGLYEYAIRTPFTVDDIEYTLDHRCGVHVRPMIGVYPDDLSVGSSQRWDLPPLTESELATYVKTGVIDGRRGR